MIDDKSVSPRSCISKIGFNMRTGVIIMRFSMVLVFLNLMMVELLFRKNEKLSAHDRLLAEYVNSTSIHQLKNTTKSVLSDTVTVSPFDPADEVYTGPQRAFDSWPSNLPFPCVHEDGIHRSPTKDGFLYVKEFKAASTTLAGVAMRIAQRQARQLSNSNITMCKARFFHLRARKFRDRDLARSFLWSMIREPTKRAVSKFYHFGVSRRNLTASVESMQEYFRQEKNSVYDNMYYLKSLTVRDFNAHSKSLNSTMVVSDILDDYNFIGITERLDESLVVLQMLLGLDVEDILYLSMKGQGSYDYWPLIQSCLYIVPPQITPEMKEWFQSEEWRQYVGGDVLLYEAVNRSLDMTIDRLGRDKFNHHLERFKWAQQKAEEACAGKVKFRCTADGERNEENDCAWQDIGCGNKCLDDVAETLSMY